ncbi:sugar transferase [Prevotella pallens]|jgi:bacterial sugar transferase|uniref:Colanic biosynthesis UDP-glucose lipid carrier transferase n=2 Tax=Prevotella pallens TaxID=60133 RepID=A0A379F0W8_9BACT|nr:sugar transferase [Prevotella pallens]RKW56526.1 MAG: sugar transferase [Prevotella sp.]EGQ17510.1 bacterial sugar transferase [Prevotella pallens ATCC 700821]MBF1451179.1 sugar transferase [Prevotella pallens]MBF1460101.1 sugar transferase [Prevotella pallens]MBF1464055.1 sugar transferase [Prevotella pallens]
MSKATQTDAMGSIQRGIKRTLDFVMSALGLILLSPIFIIISVLMKFQGNGPIFFRQIRIGYKGKPFVILKFRTISKKTEKNTPQLIAKTSCKSSTPFEKFLREHHLDELPQLWNVLVGDMSLVGPRPERKYFIDKIMEHTDLYTVIYNMRPGLTSEATLYNGYTDTMEKMLKRLQMDISYFERRSLWLDFKIIIKTFVNIISGNKF